jgi:type IV pilus assembly protein PilM
MSALAEWFTFRRSSPPAVALEIASNRVSAAAIDVRSDRTLVGAHLTEDLPDGAIAPALTAQNMRDAAAVTSAVKRVLDHVGRPRRIGLVVPDPVAKISLIRFEQVPPRRQDLEQLIRWQIRKTTPFPIEEAQVSFVEGVKAADGQEFIVSVARRDVVAEYEAVCAEAGAHPGIVDISTFNVINGLLLGRDVPEGDWLLINVAVDYASIAVLRGRDPILFRSRNESMEGSLADLVHQTAMYYEDRLSGRGFGRVILAGATHGPAGAAGAERARHALEDRLRVRVEAVAFSDFATISDRVQASALLVDDLAPMVGILARESAA